MRSLLALLDAPDELDRMSVADFVDLTIPNVPI